MEFANFSANVCKKSVNVPCVHYNPEKTKVIAKIVKDTKNKSINLKTPSLGFGFRYHFLNGRIHRKLVPKDETKFKSDNICSSISRDKSSIRVGSRRQRYSKAPERCYQFFHKNKQLFLGNDVDLDKGVNVEGNFDTNRVILQRTATPTDINSDAISYPNDRSFKLLSKSVKSVVRKLGIITLQSPNFDSTLNCKFHAKTKAGFSSEYILGYKNKLESVSASVTAAKRIWNRLNAIAADVSYVKVSSYKERLAVCSEMYKEIPGRGLYDIGARNKRDLTYDEGELCSSRVIHMPEFHNEIVIAPWIDDITLHIKNKTYGPIYIGNSISDFTRLERDMQRSKSYIEGDWKRFDSSIYMRICFLAVGILRQYYDAFDARADIFFLFLIDRLIIKNYYLPGGKVVRILHGLPSGTKCTALLGSIINLICLNYCLEKFGNKNFSFAVGGDDFLIFSKVSLSESMLEIFKERSNDLGMTFKVVSEKKIDAKFTNDLPSFFKYSIRNGNPILRTQDSLQRIFFPWNKNYGSCLKYMSFLEDQLPALGYPNASLLPFYSIYCNIFNSLKLNKEPISIGYVYKKHFSLYKKYTLYKFRRDSDEINIELHKMLCSSSYSTNKILSDKLLCIVPEEDKCYIRFPDLDPFIHTY